MKLSLFQRLFLNNHTFKIFGRAITVYDLWEDRFCFEVSKMKINAH
jgi:hypothetical protein